MEWLELKRSEWVASHYEKQAGRLRQAFPWIGHKAIATIGIADLRFGADPALALSSDLLLGILERMGSNICRMLPGSRRFCALKQGQNRVDQVAPCE